MPSQNSMEVTFNKILEDTVDKYSKESKTVMNGLWCTDDLDYIQDVMVNVSDDELYKCLKSVEESLMEVAIEYGFQQVLYTPYTVKKFTDIILNDRKSKKREHATPILIEL